MYRLFETEMASWNNETWKSFFLFRSAMQHWLSLHNNNGNRTTSCSSVQVGTFWTSYLHQSKQTILYIQIHWQSCSPNPFLFLPFWAEWVWPGLTCFRNIICIACHLAKFTRITHESTIVCGVFSAFLLSLSHSLSLSVCLHHNFNTWQIEMWQSLCRKFARLKPNLWGKPQFRKILRYLNSLFKYKISNILNSLK